MPLVCVLVAVHSGAVQKAWRRRFLLYIMWKTKNIFETRVRLVWSELFFFSFRILFSAFDPLSISLAAVYVVQVEVCVLATCAVEDARIREETLNLLAGGRYILRDGEGHAFFRNRDVQ